MAPLKAIGWGAIAVVASPAQAEGVADWRPLVTAASLRFGVPSAWIERVIHAESRGMTTLLGRPIRSRVGAMGLMQLMPGTWAAMRQRLGLGTDPDDPRDNILAGTLYLRLMYVRFGYPGLFAAYNAGPGRYANHLATGKPLPGETVAYLGAVSGLRSNTPPAAAGRAVEALFAVQYRRDVRSSHGVPASAPATVFAVRRDGR